MTARCPRELPRPRLLRAEGRGEEGTGADLPAEGRRGRAHLADRSAPVSLRLDLVGSQLSREPRPSAVKDTWEAAAPSLGPRAVHTHCPSQLLPHVVSCASSTHLALPQRPVSRGQNPVSLPQNPAPGACVPSGHLSDPR